MGTPFLYVLLQSLLTLNGYDPLPLYKQNFRVSYKTVDECFLLLIFLLYCYLIKALGLYQEKRYKYQSNIFLPKLAIVL